MRYFVLLMALVLSSCSHDDSQVNNGWVIYDLRPLQGGRVMYIDYKRGIYPHPYLKSSSHDFLFAR